MFRRPSKKQLLIRRIFVYAVMTLAVLVIVTGAILFILGYRIDGDKGRLEQGALIQFDSRPTGAKITVDGIATNTQTSGKRSVIAGAHSFLVTRDGYQDWTKSLTLKAGTLTWVDYIRLVPKNLQTKSLALYDTVHGEKASPDNKAIILQERANEPTFRLIDIRSEQIKNTTFSLDQELYSDATTENVSHTFTIDTWDEGGRYVLVKHDFNEKSEWVVVDTQEVNTSINVSRLLSIGLSDVQFAGTSGNILYGLTDGVIRKLDLSAATISRGLVSNVKSFSMYETNVLTYVGVNPANDTQQVVGMYRDGDESGHILRTVNSLDDPLSIDTARYFNNDYVAISEGLKVTVLKGRYPTSSREETTSLTRLTEFTVPAAIDSLSFSPDADFLVVQSGLTFTSYEIEHDRKNVAMIATSETQPHVLKWLDNAYLWAVYDGHLSIREFDGANVHVIMPMEPGFDATLSENDKYLYGIAKQGDRYVLQRVQLILN